MAMAKLSGVVMRMCGGFLSIFLAVRLRGVTGAKTHPNLLSTVGKVPFCDLIERTDEVALNVVGECFDGRDVNCVDLFLQLPLKGMTHELVNDGQKSRERFSRTRG